MNETTGICATPSNLEVLSLYLSKKARAILQQLGIELHDSWKLHDLTRSIVNKPIWGHLLRGSDLYDALVEVLRASMIVVELSIGERPAMHFYVPDKAVFFLTLSSDLTELRMYKSSIINAGWCETSGDLQYRFRPDWYKNVISKNRMARWWWYPLFEEAVIPPQLTAQQGFCSGTHDNRDKDSVNPPCCLN